MSERVRRVRPAAAPEAPSGAADLEVLHPERELEIGGRKITVREYGFVEGLRLASQAAPVVHELAAVSDADAGRGDLLQFANLQVLFARHEDALLDLIAQACNQPRAWVESLSDSDGHALMLTWWAVNGPFFVRRVVTELQMRLADRVSAGAASIPASPAPATGTANGSGAIPAVN